MKIKEFTSLQSSNLYTFYKFCCADICEIAQVYAFSVEKAKQVAIVNKIDYDFVTETKLLK